MVVSSWTTDAIVSYEFGAVAAPNHGSSISLSVNLTDRSALYYELTGVPLSYDGANANPLADSFTAIAKALVMRHSPYFASARQKAEVLPAAPSFLAVAPFSYRRIARSGR
jgi:hypothetical protein